MTLNKQIIYVSGLPRAGSTLLCQLLGHHPDIYSIGHSSPLSPLLERMRDFLPESSFMLSQLDINFELVYHRMLNAYRGYINGWFDETDQLFVVDKNRHWVSMIETLYLIDPNFKMLVCLRDLVDIFGSIETQHQKTQLLRFPDHTSPNLHYARLDSLFKDEGVIGEPLKGIQNLQYIADENIKDRICYIDGLKFLALLLIQMIWKSNHTKRIVTTVLNIDIIPIQPLILPLNILCLNG